MEKIDIVYLWVDGSDVVWRAAKQHWQEKLQGRNDAYKEAFVDARWADNDELLYSLRSVEKFAPWVNHIFLVTGFGQCPKWLRVSNPKLTIVPHEKIMPGKAIPTFNSNSIEKCVANIPGLSERFLLMNDDVFFWRPVLPDYFFDRRGRAIVRHTGHVRRRGFKERNPNEWKRTIIHSAGVINTIFGARLFNIFPSHGIDPYFKSGFLEGINHPAVRDEMQSDICNKFRTSSELQRWFFNLYDVCTGRAVLRRIRRKKRQHGLRARVYNFLHRRAIANSPFYCTDAVRELVGVDTPIVCINDEHGTTDRTKRSNKRFLQMKFPDKSSFEK